MPSIAVPKNHDPRLHFHGYAIVRGGTLYPLEGETFDVIGVEVKKPDRSVAGPYVGGGGLPRRRNAVKVAAGDVVALVPKYPTQSVVYRILRERTAPTPPIDVRPIVAVVPPPRRVAPHLARVLLTTTTWSPAPLWWFRRLVAPAVSVRIFKHGSVGPSVRPISYVPERAHAL